MKFPLESKSTWTTTTDKLEKKLRITERVMERILLKSQGINIITNQGLGERTK